MEPNSVQLRPREKSAERSRRARAEKFLMPLQRAIVAAGRGAGLAPSEGADMALRYAVELHANNCGVEATAELLTQAAEAGFKDLLTELGAQVTSRRLDA